MNIVYIIDGLGIGGAERTTVQLATGMRDRKHAVHVIAVPRNSFLESEDPAARALYDELVMHGIPVTVIPKKKRLSLRFVRVLTQMLKDLQPDIVHTQLYTADTFGVWSARRAGVRVIVSTEQNINISEGKIKTIVKSVMHRFHRDIACISEAVRTYVQHTTPVARSYTLPIIHNAVDLERFTSIPVHKTNSVPVMTIVGRLVPQKGHVRFLHLFSQIKTPCTLRIVGSGLCKQEIQNAISELHLEDRVSMEPARTDVEHVFSESDIVVVPSVWEGLGIVALEAQAAGCPVIASRVDGLAEVVKDSVTGRCVDMNSASEVISVCEEMLNDAALRERYGRAGREYAQKEFSAQRMCDAYEHWYTTL